MTKKKAAKTVTKKKSKKRASKYETKLKIIGTLDSILKISIPKK